MLSIRLFPVAFAIGLAVATPASAQVIRGDVNDDGPTDIADVIGTLSCLFVAGAPAPACLYARGSLSDGVAVAIVGSRRASRYGREIATWLAGELARRGLTVVSGFAVGVDAAAHRGALAAGGPTVAVLGCGLDVDYPRGHFELGRRIVHGEGGGGAEPGPRGAVITEFPCGVEPKAWHFPVRNRLIAALSLGTVVVRAAERSGSLITARRALDLGREVLAVPGAIFDRLSAGPHRLLRDGTEFRWSAEQGQAA